jgi:hypothetical protein
MVASSAGESSIASAPSDSSSCLRVRAPMTGAIEGVPEA